MSPLLTRREVLTGAAGLGAGVLLSPAPFQLLSDSALWSQNWSWRPRAPRGRLGTRYSHCTRCPAACPLSVRTCNGQPVGIGPVMGRAGWQGPPCAAGFLLHQLRFHSARLTTAAAKAGDSGPPTPLTSAAAVTVLADWLRGARNVAFVDGQPGRAVSDLYRALTAATGGRYAALEGDAPWLGALSRAAGGVALELDPSRVRTVVSLGAPLADGFGSPGLLARLRAARAHAGSALRVVQIDATASRTAMAADAWLPVASGGEAVLALGLVREVLESGAALPGAGLVADLDELRAAVAPFGPEVVRALAGVEPRALRALAAELTGAAAMARGPIGVGRALAGTDPPSSGILGPGLAGSGQPVAGLGLALAGSARSIAGLGRGLVGSEPGVAQLGPPVPRSGRAVAGPGPALVLAGTDPGGGPLGSAAELAIAALNVLTGAVSPTGPVRPRASGRLLDPPVPELLRDLPEHGVDLLVCDLEDAGRAVPAAALERVLAPGGQLVVVTSSSAGLARGASLALPRWLPFETDADAMPQAPLPRSYALAPALVAPPERCPDGIELLARAAARAGLLPAGVPLTATERVRARVTELHRLGTGEILSYSGGEASPVSRFASAEELWSALASGVWVAGAAPAGRLPRLELRRAAGEPLTDMTARVLARARSRRGGSLALVCTGWRGVASGIPVSPVAGKALRDAPVRESAGEAWVSPATARSLGLEPGARARLSTPRGAMPVRLRADETVPEGTVVVAAVATPEDLGESRGPTAGVLDLVDVDADGSWRRQGADLKEA